MNAITSKFFIIQNLEFKIQNGISRYAKTASNTVAITVTPVNDAPTLVNEIANQTATASSAFSFTFDTYTFNDVDAGDSLTYTATRSDGSALPTWLNFNADTRTFSGTPTNSDAGNLSIKVQAQDTAVASISDIFDLAIASTINAPIDIGLSGTSINENSPVGTPIGNLSTSDVDAGDTHTYQFKLDDGSLTNISGPFQIVDSQLQVNGSLSYQTQSSYTLTIRTTDALGAFFDKPFTISVNATLNNNNTITTSFANLQLTNNLDGGDGTDTFALTEGSASDTLILNLVNANQLSSINGVSLPDLSLAGFEHIYLRSFAGSAQITGDSQANSFNGGAGNDTLVGDFGSDNLTGGIGDDILYLGSDANTDTVSYSSGDGTDTIYQFVRGVGGDQLFFTGIDHIDVSTDGTNTEFRVGDGLQGNPGFGTGTLLVSMVATTGFSATDINVNLVSTGQLLFG